MKIEPFSLDHQVILEYKFKQLNSFLSEYSFANLYLFRFTHQYEVIFYNEYVFIKGISRNQTHYLMPTEYLTGTYLVVLKDLMQKMNISIVYPISEPEKTRLEGSYTSAEHDDSESDYIYYSKTLAEYPGRHLSKKRNLVNQLFENFKIESFVYSNQYYLDAKGVLDYWRSEQSDPNFSHDYDSCLEGLQLSNTLNLTGKIIFANAIAIGFTLGEWLNPDCFVIHFSKAQKKIKGAYQFLLQDTASSICKPTTFINLEQDLGIASIRQAKRSYSPENLLKKSSLQLL